MAWWCFYFYTGWHVLKRLCKTNRSMFKNDLLPNDGGVNDLSGFLKLVYGFVLSSTCLPNRNFMNTQRPCGRMKGWEFASKDPTNINWSTAHSSEYMVSSKCWVWMAFNCVNVLVFEHLNFGILLELLLVKSVALDLLGLFVWLSLHVSHRFMHSRGREIEMPWVQKWQNVKKRDWWVLDR